MARSVAPSSNRQPVDRAVKTHVREIFLKLGVSDRTQAAIRALRLGIVG